MKDNKFDGSFVGEIKHGRELGYARRGNFIWAECARCGKKRWIQYISGKPDIGQRRCQRCAGDRTGHYGEGHWKGGRHPHGKYIEIRVYPDDFFYPMANGGGYVLEHRLVMAKHLGRNLHRWELVHHKGTKYPSGSRENKLDNRVENLQLVTDDRHMQITILERRIDYLEKRVTILEAENVLLGGLREKQSV